MPSRSPLAPRIAFPALVAAALLAAAMLLAPPAEAAGPFEAGTRVVLRGEGGDCTPLRDAPSPSAPAAHCLPDGSAATTTGDRLTAGGVDWEYVRADGGRGGYADARRLAPAEDGGAPSGAQPGADAPSGAQQGDDAPSGAQPGDAAPSGAQPGGDAPSGAQPGADAPSGAQQGADAPSGAQPGADAAAGTLPIPPPGGFTQGLAGAADPRAVAAAQPFEVVAMWLFEPPSQTHLTYIPGAPDFVNTLGDASLRADSVITVRRAGVLDREALPPPPAAPPDAAIEGTPNAFPAPPAGGYAQGLAGTNDPVALAAAQPFGVRAIWVLDAPSQEWLTYIPGAPAFVNTLARGLLRPGSAVTIRAAEPAPEPEPEPEAGTTVEVTITYYYCEGTGGDGGGFCGHMANGEIVHDGAAACARSRLGERFRIVGDPKVYTCKDTGSAVDGLHRDIWFRYSADAAAWARRMLDAGHFEDRQLADGRWQRYARIAILP